MNPFPLFRHRAEQQDPLVWSDEVGQFCADQPAKAEECGIELHRFDLADVRLDPPSGELLGLLIGLLEEGWPVDDFVAAYRRWTEEYGDGLRPLLGRLIAQAFSAGYDAAKREPR